MLRALVTTHADNADERPDGQPPAWLSVLTDIAAAMVVFGLAIIFALQERYSPPAAAVSFAPPELAPCQLGSSGYLRGRLHGDLQREIDWSGSEFNCDGMLRPDDAGLRLMFEGTAADGGLLLVIGVDASIDEILGRELPANLTIVDTGNGRFFHSGDGERCWINTGEIDVADQDGGRSYRLAGRFFCAGALAEVNGPGATTPGEFEFAGRLTADSE